MITTFVLQAAFGAVAGMFFRDDEYVLAWLFFVASIAVGFAIR